ncbi:MAG: hypothetical protein IPN71_13385 [Fibrobacteres bacterium]|nr:hypothetical protein [Fibrobacterota bacterium]
MKRIIGLFAVLAMGSGCAIQTHYFQHGAVQPTNMVDADSVKVFSGPAPAGTSFQVLGSVGVDLVGDGEAALALLKEETAAMGANAVMDVRLTKINSYAARTGMSGVAIVIK